MDDLDLKYEYRCPHCSKLIIKGILLKSYQEYKCPRCKKIISFSGLDNNKDSHKFSLLTDNKGKIILTSSSIKSILGFSPKEIERKNISFLYPQDKEQIDQILVSKLHKFKYFRIDTSLLDKQGQVLPVFIYFKLFQELDKKYILRVIHLVKDCNCLPPLPKAAGKLADCNLCGLVTEVDLNGKFLFLSKEIENYFGYKQEDILGSSVFNFLDPAEAEQRKEHMKLIFQRRQSYRRTNVRLKHKNGHFIETESFGSPLYDDLGNLLGYKYIHWINR